LALFCQCPMIPWNLLVAGAVQYALSYETIEKITAIAVLAFFWRFSYYCYSSIVNQRVNLVILDKPNQGRMGMVYDIKFLSLGLMYKCAYTNQISNNTDLCI